MVATRLTLFPGLTSFSFMTIAVARLVPDNEFLILRAIVFLRLGISRGSLKRWV
jgi:hypothetical protein